MATADPTCCCARSITGKGAIRRAEEKGFLLYIKSSMTGNETAFLQKYRAEHPTFPHESTADQLFDEAQFEAYRALGEHVGEELFRPELVDPIQPEPGQPKKLADQPSVREWFQGLANSLLEEHDDETPQRHSSGQAKGERVRTTPRAIPVELEQ
jgi:hypothetical protein